MANHFNKWTLDKAREAAQLYRDAHNQVASDIERRLKPELDGEKLSRFATMRLKSLQAHLADEIDSLSGEVTDLVEPMLSEAHELTLEEIADMAREPQFAIFEGAAAAEYLRQGILLEQHMESTLRGYSSELLDRVRRIINLAVLTRRSWQSTARLIQRAFGEAGRPLGGGLGYYGSTGAAAQAARLVVTELFRARALGHSHYIEHDADVIGIEVKFGGGPCRTGICQARAGRYMGKEAALAELARIPRHPWCRCYPQYIYRDLNWAGLKREMAA